MPDDSDTPPVMTTDQVAKYLGMSDQKVLKLASTGELPGAKLGREWRFLKSEIDRLLRGQAES